MTCWLRHQDFATRSASYDRSPHAGVLRCTTRFENAHRTARREVLYRYHPWFGREVYVHAVIDKVDGVVFRCTLEGSEASRWLEVPAWMFDRAAGGREPSLSAEPFVSMEALNALSALLDLALKSTVPSSNALLVGACGTSHDQNRGEAHGTESGVASEHRPEQRAAWSATDGSVQGRPGGRKRRRAPWLDLPKDAQDALVGLMTQLILEHARTSAMPSEAVEAGDDR